MILSETVLMIEPRGFSFNSETSDDNYFQSTNGIKAPAEAALREFHDLKKKLMRAGITVTVLSPANGHVTPDAVFPNNWFSTTPYGQFILYPMMAVNRRLERRADFIEKIKKDYPQFIDLSPMEEKGIFLEGTGSLVLDHENKIGYAALSKRTSEEALKEWSKLTGYELITFTTGDENHEAVYHTNVILTLGDGFAIVCLDAITNEVERERLRQKLSEKNELIIINKEQMNSFCGNCLELKNGSNEKFLIMSAQAYNSFTEAQKSRLIRYVSIIYSALPTIESIGGGSARCMMAELF